MNRFGHKLGLSIFGESHGSAIGIVIDGLPAGEEISEEMILAEMERRAPGKSGLSTARRESDAPEIVSGISNGVTTGFPVCAVIKNKDARSGDYTSILRPGHADMTALVKYAGFADMRGGGHFSGRLTAPLVFAGSLAKQILIRRGVRVFSRITEIAGVKDPTGKISLEDYERVSRKELPVLDDAAAKKMRDSILAAKEDGDSVGGVVEVCAFGLPAGLGEPFFGSCESEIASILFSIPAVKGVEFGAGFGLAGMRGSEANDGITVADGRLCTVSNHNGGVLGGITNGMPLVARVAIKPTPSISKEQRTVDPVTMKPVAISVKGRHDPCIVPRAAPVIEAAVAVAALDLMLLQRGDSV